MSSRWFIRTVSDTSDPRCGAPEHSNDSSQPVTFEQLAQLLADGVIEDSDLVQPDEGMDWQPVETVIGLCRAAAKLRSAQRQHPEFHGDAAAETRTEVVPIPQVKAVRTRSSATDPLYDTDRTTTPGTAAVSASGNIRCGVSVSKPVSWVRVLLLSASIGVAAWACWSFWNESRRFPRPAHLTDNPQPWILPGIGAVSGFEAMMLAVDAIAVFAFLFWWFRTKRQTD